MTRSRYLFIVSSNRIKSENGIMNIAEIESELLSLTKDPFDPSTFIYRLIEIYHVPKATITKLKQGTQPTLLAPAHPARSRIDRVFGELVSFGVAEVHEIEKKVEAAAGVV